MVHFPLTIVGGRYHGLYTFRCLNSAVHGLWYIVHFPLLWTTFCLPYSAVDTMTIVHGTPSVGHTRGSMPWTIVHGTPSVGHTRGSIPWTIVHGTPSVGHTRGSIPWTIVHGTPSVGHTRGSIPWTIVHGTPSVGHTQGLMQ